MSKLFPYSKPINVKRLNCFCFFFGIIKIRTSLYLDDINFCELAGQCPLQESNNNIL